MKETLKKVGTAIRTNENDARTKAIVAGVIIFASVGAGFYFSKKNAPQPLVLLVDEVTEVVSDATSV